MKQFFCILFSLVFCSQFYAQTCSNAYFYTAAGTKSEMSIYNDKDKVTSVNQQEIKSITNTATGFEAIVNSSTLNDKGKLTTENIQTKIICDNGVIKIDIQSMFINGEQLKSFKDMNVTVEGDGLTIPSDMTTGSKLADAHTTIKFAMGALTLMNMSFDITNREVGGQEKITTTAGDFDCIKMNYDLKMKILGKKNFKVTQWFSKGVGLVKSVSANEKGEIQNKMELTSLKKG